MKCGRTNIGSAIMCQLVNELWKQQERSPLISPSSLNQCTKHHIKWRCGTPNNPSLIMARHQTHPPWDCDVDDMHFSPSHGNNNNNCYDGRPGAAPRLIQDAVAISPEGNPPVNSQQPGAAAAALPELPGVSVSVTMEQRHNPYWEANRLLSSGE